MMTLVVALFIIAILLPSLNAVSLHKTAYIEDYYGNSGFSFTNCSKPDDKSRLEIISISVIPNPPKKGSLATLDLKMQLKEQVTSGLVEATLNYGTISIVDEKLDFCDLITQINKNCPVPPGPFNLHFSKTIPDFVPSGEYEGKVTFFDQDSKELVCMDVKATI